MIDLEQDSPEADAIAKLPGDMVVYEPFYALSVRGEGQPSGGDITIPIPYEIGAVETADLYAFDGSEWQWLQAQPSDGLLFFEAELDGFPSLLAVTQAQAGIPNVAFGVTKGTAVTDARQETGACVLGLNIGGDLGIVGNAEPMCASDYALVSNLVDGVLRTDLVDNMLIDETSRQAHASAIATSASDSGFSGVELSYAGFDPNLKAEFSAFVADLANELANQGLALAVAVDTPQLTADGWDTGPVDWQAIGNAADAVRIPVFDRLAAYAPGGAMDQLLSWAVTQVDRRKIELSASASAVDIYDGAKTEITYAQALAVLANQVSSDNAENMLLPGEQIRFSAAPDPTDAAIQFDPNAQVYFFDYEDESGGIHKVLLETDSSVMRKLQYVNRFALGGLKIDGALSPEADADILGVIESNAQNIAITEPQFAMVWSVTGPSGNQLGEQVVPLTDPNWTWTAPNNPGGYIIGAAVSDDGGQTEIETVAELDLTIPTPTPTPTPTNTPTPLPTNTPAPTATPKPTAKPQAAASSGVARAGNVGGYFGYGIQAHIDGDMGRIFDHVNAWALTGSSSRSSGSATTRRPASTTGARWTASWIAANARGVNVLFSVVKAPSWARPPGDTDEGPPADPNTYGTFMREHGRPLQGARQGLRDLERAEPLLRVGRTRRQAERRQVRRAAQGGLQRRQVGRSRRGGDQRRADAHRLQRRRHRHRRPRSIWSRCTRLAWRATATPWARTPAATTTRPTPTGAPVAIPRRPASRGTRSFFFRGTMESYRNIMVKYGDGHKRIWPTEFGWATVEGLGVGPAAGYGYAADNTEAEQAQFLVRAYEMGRQLGLGRPHVPLEPELCARGGQPATKRPPLASCATTGARGRPLAPLRDMPK